MTLSRSISTRWTRSLAGDRSPAGCRAQFNALSIFQRRSRVTNDRITGGHAADDNEVTTAQITLTEAVSRAIRTGTGTGAEHLSPVLSVVLSVRTRRRTITASR